MLSTSIALDLVVLCNPFLFVEMILFGEIGTLICFVTTTHVTTVASIFLSKTTRDPWDSPPLSWSPYFYSNSKSLGYESTKYMVRFCYCDGVLKFESLFQFPMPRVCIFGALFGTACTCCFLSNTHAHAHTALDRRGVCRV